MQVSADRKFDMEKDNVNKELKLGRFSSKRGRKTASLSRPVSFNGLMVYFFLLRFDTIINSFVLM